MKKLLLLMLLISQYAFAVPYIETDPFSFIKVTQNKENNTASVNFDLDKMQGFTQRLE